MNNVHSVTSNAVAQALSYNSSQEVFIGYYDGQPLYRKCVFVSGSDLPAKDGSVELNLPSEYSNRAVVNIKANMVREDFSYNIPLGSYLDVYITQRTKLNIRQSFSSGQTQYNLLAWLDYVYLS